MFHSLYGIRYVYSFYVMRYASCFIRALCVLS